MAAATKNKEPLTADDLLAPKPRPIDIDAHEKDMARRRAEREERCALEERLRLCNPKYAAEVESKKAVFRWKVEFNVIERKQAKQAAKADKYADDDGGEDADEDLKFRAVTKFAEAQNEATAWAIVCDKMGEYPSPKIAKPKFTRLKQIKM